MSKKLLSEAQVRRFQALATIHPLNEMGMYHEAEEGGDAGEEMEMGAEEEPMDMDAEEAPPAEEEAPAEEEEEMLQEALKGIKYVPSQKEVVKVVAQRVAKRLQEAKRAQAKLNKALGKK